MVVRVMGRPSAPRLLTIACAALLAACLSNPTPHPAADANGAGETTTTTTDGATADAVGDVTWPGLTDDGAADTGGAPPPEDYPPPRPVLVRDVRVFDLDRDGVDDVVVQSWPTSMGDRGLYVFFGRPEQLFRASDAFLATSMAPLVVTRTALRDASSTLGDWELVALGASDPGASGSPAGTLEIHPYDRAAGLFRPAIARDTSIMGLVPDGGTPELMYPVSLVSEHVDGDGVPDLLMSGGFGLIALHPAAWSPEAFTGSDHSALDVEPGWDSIVEIVPVLVGTDRWLALWQEHGLMRFLPLDATGVRLDGLVDVQLAAGMRGTFVADLDGEPPSEIVGFVDDTLSVVALAPPTAHRYELDVVLPLVDLTLDDVAVIDVDRSGERDIILLDRVVDGASASRLIVVRDPALRDDRVETLAQPAWTALPTGMRARAIVAGRFGRDRDEVWTFDEDGTALCHAWPQGGSALAPCPPP